MRRRAPARSPSRRRGGAYHSTLYSIRTLRTREAPRASRRSEKELAFDESERTDRSDLSLTSSSSSSPPPPRPARRRRRGEGHAGKGHVRVRLHRAARGRNAKDTAEARSCPAASAALPATSASPAPTRLRTPAPAEARERACARRRARFFRARRLRRLRRAFFFFVIRSLRATQHHSECAEREHDAPYARVQERVHVVARRVVPRRLVSFRHRVRSASSSARRPPRAAAAARHGPQLREVGGHDVHLARDARLEHARGLRHGYRLEPDEWRAFV